jgi:O-antigen/teichoic acid export membrane protein
MRAKFQQLKQIATPERLRQLWYAPQLAIAMALTMVRLLIIARILNVDEFATFNNGILVSGSFTMLGCLGLQFILQRKWPILLVQGKEYHGLVLAAQANLAAVGCAIVGLALVGAGVSVANLTPQILAIGILHGLAQQLFMIATIESRSRGEVIEFAGQSLIRAVTILVLGIATAYITGSSLLSLAVEGCSSFLLSLAFFKKSTRHVALKPFAIYRLAFFRLGKVGWTPPLTLLAVSIVTFFQFSADRWFASDRLGTAGFAQYAFACIILAIAQAAQALINTSLYPFIARRYGQSGQAAAFKVCWVISVAIFVLGAMAALPVGYTLYYAIEAWYPRYLDATKLLPIFLLIATLRLSDFWSSFLTIAHHERLLFVLNLSAAAGSVGIFSAYLYFSSSPSITLNDAGILAGLLAVLTYVSTALAAWWVGRARS